MAVRCIESRADDDVAQHPDISAKRGVYAHAFAVAGGLPWGVSDERTSSAAGQAGGDLTNGEHRLRRQRNALAFGAWSVHLSMRVASPSIPYR